MNRTQAALATAGVAIVVAVVALLLPHNPKAHPGEQGITISMNNGVCTASPSEAPVRYPGFAVWDVHSGDTTQYEVRFTGPEGSPFYTGQYDVQPSQSSGPVNNQAKAVCGPQGQGSCKFSYQIFANGVRCDRASGGQSGSGSAAYIGIHINP